MTFTDTAPAEPVRGRRNKAAEVTDLPMDTDSTETEVAAEVSGPSTTITIAGKSLRVPNRYAEGHVLTKGEAAQLNQVFHENIRNNMAKKIKDDTSKSDAEWQSEIDAYAEKYQPGVRSGGGRTADPVRREAKELAKAAVLKALRARGEDPKTYSAETIKNEVELHVDKFMEKARRIVAERESEEVSISNLAAA